MQMVLPALQILQRLTITTADLDSFAESMSEVFWASQGVTDPLHSRPMARLRRALVQAQVRVKQYEAEAVRPPEPSTASGSAPAASALPRWTPGWSTHRDAALRQSHALSTCPGNFACRNANTRKSWRLARAESSAPRPSCSAPHFLTIRRRLAWNRTSSMRAGWAQGNASSATPSHLARAHTSQCSKLSMPRSSTSARKPGSQARPTQRHRRRAPRRGSQALAQHCRPGGRPEVHFG